MNESVIGREKELKQLDKDMTFDTKVDNLFFRKNQNCR